MQRSSRTIAGLFACLWALALNGGAAPASALAAGALTVKCTSTDYTSITAALAAAPPSGATISVCAGAPYTEHVQVQNFTKISLVGQGSPVLTPPSASYTGAIVDVSSSDSVTISGFVIDGAGKFNTTTGSTMIGIAWDNSGGSISKNLVRNINHNNTDAQGVGIKVTNLTPTLRKVAISQNTVYDYQQNAIYVSGSNKLTLSKNLLIGAGKVGNIPSAIFLGSLPDGAVVSGNTIRGDFNSPLLVTSTYGIYIDSTSGAKFSQNKITQVATGIKLTDTDCGAHSGNKNTISGNTITDVSAGIWLASQGGSGVCDIQVNQNKITGNKIYQHLSGGVGISMQAGPPSQLDGSVVTGNTLLGDWSFAIDHANDTNTVGLIPPKNKVGPVPPPGL